MRFSTSVSAPCLLLGTAFATLAAAQSSNKTADSHCGSNWCLAAIYDPGAANVNYTLDVASGGKQIGWYGVGVGSQMKGANMMIGWVNADLSLTMSQRGATGHSEPSTSDVSAAAFTPNTTKSMTDNDHTVFMWTMPQTTAPGSKFHLIWAANPSDNPSDSSTSSNIKFHGNNYGDFTLDMTKAYSETEPLSTDPAAASDGSTVAADSRVMTRNNRLLITHMTFMLLGWLILIPSGILVARYGRMFMSSEWFPAHRGIQIVAFCAIVIGFGLGVGSREERHFDSIHTRLGLVLFIILCVQVILGSLIHALYRSNRRYRPVQNYVHAVFGIVLFALAIWTIHEGFEIWDWGVPDWTTYIVYAWAAVLAALYIGGLLLLPRQYRTEAALRELKEDLSTGDLYQTFLMNTNTNTNRERASPDPVQTEWAPVTNSMSMTEARPVHRQHPNYA